MAKEVERKFLVKADGWRALSRRAASIRQFYLSDETAGRSLRVRIKDDLTATLTMKFGGDALIRDEFEYPIPLPDARELEGFALGRVIVKTRHHVEHDGLLFEVDVFERELAGLIVAELETAETVDEHRLPAWLGREITGVPAYYNARLAFAPLWDIAAA